MKVVFLKTVPSVAKHGDIKEVSDGYARNFLLPKKLAQQVTPDVLHLLTNKQTIKSQQERVMRDEFQSSALRIATTPIAMKVRAGSTGKIFGAVTAKMISEALQHYHFSIKKEWITIEMPIKIVGDYAITIKFPDGTQSLLRLAVQPE